MKIRNKLEFGTPNESKRSLIKIAGWSVPVVTAITLPRHAQATPVATTAAPTTAAPTTAPPPPDLTVGVQLSAVSINRGDSLTATYNLANVGSGPTDGSQIVLRISKQTHNGTFSLGAVPGGWTATDGGNYYDLTSNAIIALGLANRVTFTVTYQHDGTDESAILVVSATVLGGSGGEINTGNNFDRAQFLIN